VRARARARARGMERDIRWEAFAEPGPDMPGHPGRTKRNPVKEPLEEGSEEFKLRQEQALARYRRAAVEERSPVAQTRVGYCYEHGWGVERDVDEAVRWYKRAAAQGHPTALFNLALAYHVGRGRKGKPPDVAAAARLYAQAAEKGHMEAAYNLAFLYAEGNGVERDDGEALRLLRTCVPLEDEELPEVVGTSTSKSGEELKELTADVCATVGQCYLQGRGLEGGPQPSRAARWFRKAAKKGHVGGMKALGKLLQAGRGVERDLKESFEWIKLAAQSGDAESQCNLGVFYENGWGIRAPDPESAARWFGKAVGQDHPAALLALGNLYVRGFGVEEDLARAEELYRKAINAGEDRARLLLAGVRLRQAQGPADLVECRALAQDALDAGVTDAAVVLDKIDEQLRRPR